MTEAQWLACNDPIVMLDFLQGKVSDRKLRLFGVAVCRQEARLLVDRRSHEALAASERYADGLATADELRRAEDAAWAARDQIYQRSFADGTYDHTGWLTKAAAEDAAWIAQVEWDISRIMYDMSDRRWRRRCCVLLRDLFNPVHAFTPGASWGAPNVVTVAQAIYNDRTFERMPELAATLGEAGCNDVAVLRHCRQQKEHVRGCWVVDLILGKE